MAFPLIFCILYNLHHVTYYLQTIYLYDILHDKIWEFVWHISTHVLYFIQSAPCHLLTYKQFTHMTFWHDTNLRSLCGIFPLIFGILCNLHHVIYYLQTYLPVCTFYIIKSETICVDISTHILYFIQSAPCHLLLTNNLPLWHST